MLATVLSTFGSCVMSVCDSPEPLHAANTAGLRIPPWVVADTAKNSATAASTLVPQIITLLSNLIDTYVSVEYLNRITKYEIIGHATRTGVNYYHYLVEKVDLVEGIIYRNQR